MAPQRDNVSAADLDEEHQTRLGPDWAPAVERTAPQYARPAHFQPRPPAEVVYLHTTRAPSALGHAPDHPAAAHAPREARRPLRGMVPLLWTALFAGAALMHAAEADRSANLMEPTAVELQMQERPTRTIRAAWRSTSDNSSTASEAPDPVTKKDADSTPVTEATAKPAQREQTTTEAAANGIAEQDAASADRSSEASTVRANETPDRAQAGGAKTALSAAEKPDAPDMPSRKPDDQRPQAASRQPANAPKARRHAPVAKAAAATSDFMQNEYGVAFFVRVARRTP